MAPGDPISLRVAVERSGLIATGGSVLVAASGGPDSMALLDALAGWRGDGGPARVIAAHFDHRLRPDSDRDAMTVAGYCDERGVEFETASGDVRARSERTGESVEATARAMRYDFLERAADRAGADAIATGHTRDDHVETVLMRVLRGAGVRGLAGIPERRGRIVRPLLSVSRADTRAYCERNGVAFVDDPTNSDPSFTRNALRHRVLPELRDIVPGVDAGLERLAANSRDTLARLRARTDPLLDAHLRRDPAGEWRLERSLADGARVLDDEALFVLLADALTRISNGRIDAGRVHFEALRRLLRSSRTGDAVSIPGATVRCEHDGIVILLDDERNPTSTAARKLAVPGVTRAGDATIRADYAPFDLDAATRGESGGIEGIAVAYFDVESIRPPLVVRSPRAGDRMHPFGLTGRKKLSDIFIDRKIPRRRRPRSLVIADRREILWLVGVATSEAARIDGPGRRALRITVDRPTE